LEKHCEIAKQVGLKYVYIGNVPGHKLENTYCPECGSLAIQRYGFNIEGWNLDERNCCKQCGYGLPIVGSLQKKTKRWFQIME
jgi:pyruvate formate lyase activating enzyme